MVRALARNLRVIGQLYAMQAQRPAAPAELGASESSATTRPSESLIVHVSGADGSQQWQSSLAPIFA